MNQTTLFKYNFRVLMLNNWMLLVFPIAVSQLTVFWLVLTRTFTLELPAASVEMITPILAAFLGSHLLSAEYRTRVGAILASRPVHIGKIVSMRLIVMLSLVWSLAIISLMAYRFMMKPYDIALPFLACIPPTLFLTMVAVTFATLFRNSLAGFSVAAVFWLLDLVPGAPLQPYLSLRSLSYFYSVEKNPLGQSFSVHWWIAKIVLLVGAMLLYIYHNRLVFSVGSPHTVRMRARSAAAAAAILVLYILSGAILKVSFGYANRGELPRGDLAWFRYQMASFGPLPVSSLFGSPFRSYVGDIGNPWRLSGGEEADLLGDSEAHRLALRSAMDSSPNSVWAASIMDAEARLGNHGDATPDIIIGRYRAVVSRFPNSPYAPNALREIARTYIDANKLPEARVAYEEMLKQAPASRYRSEAYRFLYESENKAGNTATALQWAEKWSATAPVQERFEALLYVMRLRKAAGDADGAKRAAQDTIAAVKTFESAVAADTVVLTPAQQRTCVELSRTAEREAKEMSSGGVLQ